MNTKIKNLERMLASEIPLLSAMQISIPHYDVERLVLAAPLSSNSNPHGTAFGGSIATLGIACGWAWVHLWLEEVDIRNKLVIQKHCVEYLRPVQADFIASCHSPTPTVKEAFLEQLRTDGKASIDLQITTASIGQTAAQHTASYTAVTR